MDNQIVSLEVSTRATILPTCNTAVTTSITAASCADNDGKATFNITGGTPPYQIAIDASTIYSSTFTIGGLKAGTHTVSVRDNIGCIVTQSFVVSKNCTVINCNNVIISLSPTAATCAGNDGILDKLVLGGTPPYLFSVDGKTPQADPSFSGLSVGAHYVIVKDNVGCNVRKDFTILQDCVPICAVTATAQPTNVTCAGNDGKVTITAGSGTAPYSYAIDSKAAQTGNSFSSLTEGNHNVVVTDAKGCTKAVGFTIGTNCTTPTCALIASTQITPVTCVGNDGKITITAAGGTAPYQYAISGTPWQTNNVLTALTEKSYSIWVGDSKGCNILITVAVTKSCTPTIAPTCALTASTQITPVTCVGNDGKVNVTTAGGIAPYTYALNGKSPQSDPVFYTLAEGTHSIVVTDAKACTKSVVFTMTKTCTPTVVPCAITIAHQTTAATCLGNDGKVVVTPTGGIAPYTYAIDGKLPQNSATFSNLTEGSHTIVITDSKACSKSVTFTISKICTTCTSPVTFSFTWYNTSCFINTGKIVVNSVTGASCYQYKVVSANVVKDWQSSNTFTNLPAGNYDIYVRNCNLLLNCSSKSYSQAKIICSFLREGEEESSELTIFPNPSKREVNIRMDEAFAERLSDIKIYDILGNVILQTDTRSQEISFEILKDGFYIIALASKNGSVVTKKLIISNKEE
jgi:large repetitive protein